MPTFRSYQPNQTYLLPPDMKDWLDEGDLVYFLMDIMKTLDLKPISDFYASRKGGSPPYDPLMMTSLLFYSYCVGVFSSRKIEKATYERIPFRVLTAGQHPDHDTIAHFRKTHLSSLAGLFVEVLELCEVAGLVKLGHVSLDGSKVKANASKHKAMSYKKMCQREKELKKEIEALFEKAKNADEQEDEVYGKKNKGNTLPEELALKESRLKKIQEAQKVLKQRAKDKADKKREEQKKKTEELKASEKKRRGPPPKEPVDTPNDKDQYNFTDPESRIMKDGASKSFEQAYNCQVIVDAEHQIIIAAGITQKTSDIQQVKPLVEKMKSNLGNRKPDKLSADTGYMSEANLAYLEEEKIDSYIALERQKHHKKKETASPKGRIPAKSTLKERMARKLKTQKGKEIYSHRKHIVEAPFGQIKECRGFRRFMLRGFENADCEWLFVSLTHNFLKLFKYGDRKKLKALTG